MATDAIRTELKVSGDKRIRVGLRGAIEHIGGRHGLSAAEQREFANEVDAECCKITAEGEPGASCEVVVEEQEDQIEVKVQPLERHLHEGSLGNLNAAKRSESRSPHNSSTTATLVRRFHGSTTRS